jgi:hypothetical protein
MKNQILFTFTVLSFLLSGCGANYQSGAESFEKASTTDNLSARIISKKPLDFDAHFGVLVAAETFPASDTTGTKVTALKIWIPKITYLLMPEPSDTTMITAYYIKSVIAPQTSDRGAIPVNFTTSFKVENPKVLAWNKY